MKIILNAFGKLRGDIMDVPEETGITFKMELLQKPEAVGSSHFIYPPVRTMCEFEWRGKYDAMTGAKLYVLSDITKI